MTDTVLGDTRGAGSWLKDSVHRSALMRDAERQARFFAGSCRAGGGFHTLDHQGRPLASGIQELHTTTRLIHSFALCKAVGMSECDAVIDQGMAYLETRHHDDVHGGYFWSLRGTEILDDRKLAYGHVFVLLAASSAAMVGHPEAERLLAQIDAVLDKHFWEEDVGLFADEWNRDWTPFSDYRGMNANMHGVEALLAAYECTGQERFLHRAGRILDFFLRRQASVHAGRIPEHYNAQWQVDASYSGDPMFRPAGTTPGHSFEFARLLLQYRDLLGEPDEAGLALARLIVERAWTDAWDIERGGLAYTLDSHGQVANPARYWWPVTEAIGVLASLLKIEFNAQHEQWYRLAWSFADQHLIDHERGGWYPELGERGGLSQQQFIGKPDLYHALQADLFPLVAGVSRQAEGLKALQFSD